MVPNGVSHGGKVSPMDSQHNRVKHRGHHSQSMNHDGSHGGRSLMEFSFFSEGHEIEGTGEDRDGRFLQQLCSDTPHTKQGRRVQLARMLLVPFLPILGIAIYSSLNLSDAVNQENQLFTIENNIMEAHDLSDISHCLQLERAEAVHFLDLRTDAAREELSKFYEKTNNKLSRLTKWPVVQTDIDNLADKKEIKDFVSLEAFFNWLQSGRLEVLKMHETMRDAIIFYNTANDFFLKAMGDKIKMVLIKEIRQLMIAMNNYARAKEEYSIMLTILMEYFTKGNVKQSDMITFLQTEALGSEHLDTAAIYAPQSQQKLRQLVDANPTMESFLNQSSQDIKNPNYTCSECSSTTVLTSITKYLDILKNVSSELEEQVISIIYEQLGDARVKVTYSAVILVGEVLLSAVLVHMIKRMTTAVQDFANDAYRKGQQIKVAKKRTDLLLAELLPPSVASALKEGRPVDPETYDMVSIYFSDIVGFTTLSSKSTPFEVVTLLSLLYGCFDEVLARYDVYKVETIGDAYMVASGVPRRNGKKHAAHIADIALELLNAINVFMIPQFPDEKLRVRIGLHSGTVAAGVVGSKMPRYCLFGNTVYQGSGMESKSLPMKIHASEVFKTCLDAVGGYLTEERTDRVKIGPGETPTYWLLAKYDKNNPGTYALQDPELLNEL